MKKVIIIFLVFFYAIVSFAQSESAKPTFGVKLDREVAVAKIEKETGQRNNLRDFIFKHII